MRAELAHERAQALEVGLEPRVLVVAASASNTTVVSPAGITCTKIDAGASSCKFTEDFSANFKKALGTGITFKPPAHARVSNVRRAASALGPSACARARVCVCGAQGRSWRRAWARSASSRSLTASCTACAAA